MNEDQSNWWEWDKDAKRWTFKQTEDHIFAPYGTDGGKRIGDMTRDELIHVIAMGYQDREDLAVALVSLADKTGVTDHAELKHARRIVARLTREGK
jgi:hypothetical protein